MNFDLFSFQPERIDPPDPQRPDYDIRADVWSLGITLVTDILLLPGFGDGKRFGEC